MPRRRAPMLVALAIATALLLVIGGTLAVRAGLADPLSRGRAALADGDYRSARVDLMTALEASPGDVAARIDLARALNGLGRGREAERHLARARDLGASDLTLRVDRAEALLNQQRAADALAALSGSVPAVDRVRALRIAGQANYRMGRIDAATAAFAAAVQGSANSAALADAWVARARFRLAEQDMTGADAGADQARRLAPRSVAGYAVKADIVRTRAGPVAALPWYRAALDRSPDDVPTLIEYAAALGEAGQYRAMLGPLRRAADLDPANARALFLQAVIAARGGEPALARTLLNRMTGPDADLPAVLLVRTAVELSLDAPVAAGSMGARLIERQPDNRAARRLYSLALTQADNSRGTIEAIDPLTISDDADSWSLLLLSRSFSALDWHGDAAQPLDRAQRLAPGRPPALATRQAAPPRDDAMLDPAFAVPVIRGRLASGQAASALVLAQRLAAANPGVAPAHLLLGDAAMAMGDVASAALHYRRAADLRFDEAAMLRLVEALSRQGHRAAATDALTAFLHRWPQNIAAMRVAAAIAAEDGDWPAALGYLEAAHARLGSGDALLLAQIARAQLELGDASAALPLAAHAYRLLPGNATISGTYGLALDRAGVGSNDVRDLLIKATQLAPTDPVLRRWRAEVGG